MGTEKAGATEDDEDMMSVSTFGNMKLMRASELEQPAPAGHFLREFGQSERLLIDGGVRSGSVPQVLMLMNGRAQEMLTNRDSLVNRNIAKQATPEAKTDAVFLSILNRHPSDRERDIAKRTLEEFGEEEGYSHIIWSLINTREFCFVQ
jgi:hypothetical protein